MNLDPANPVVALCAEGMQKEGTPSEAKRCFQEAWDLRQDDVDASIAAHYLARHQDTPEETLWWNHVALQHAQAAKDDRVRPFMASLHLNYGDSLLATGDLVGARGALAGARSWVALLPDDGYRALVSRGIERLGVRLEALSNDD
jgi:hypothetical protein